MPAEDEAEVDEQEEDEVGVRVAVEVDIVVEVVVDADAFSGRFGFFGLPRVAALKSSKSAAVCAGEKPHCIGTVFERERAVRAVPTMAPLDCQFQLSGKCRG